MELKIGIMKNAELAEWFGMGLKNFTNHKSDRLKDLQEYAEFEEIKGKVNITKILDSTPFDKNRNKNKELIKRVFDENWNESGLDTCRNVTNKIYKKYSDKLTIKDTTAYNYTIKTRNEEYGKPFGAAGISGSCHYLWCKKEELESGEIILTPLTDEEQQIKQRLLKKYFATDEEKDILIREMVDAGEITKEEAYDLSCEYRGLNQAGFMAFKAELEEVLDCKIVKGTMIERENNFLSDGNK